MMSKTIDQSPPPSTPSATSDRHSDPHTRDADRDLERDSEDFSALMKKDREKSRDKTSDKGGASGESILSAFQGRGDSLAALQSGKTGSASAVSDIAAEIADRILVSETKLSGREEVRILLKDSILPGTEIRIARTGGELQIDLMTTSSDSYRFLAEQQSSLQDHLKSKLGDDVRVQVTEAQTGEHPQDGRSRQQRDIIEEAQDRED